jgi:hypothetical protein
LRFPDRPHEEFEADLGRVDGVAIAIEERPAFAFRGEFDLEFAVVDGIDADICIANEWKVKSMGQ